MTNSKFNQVQVQSLKNRLEESEAMLFKATKLADEAYFLLSEGDVSNCRDVIGELIHSMSEHFYDEIH
jgi:hypothetical protein